MNSTVVTRVAEWRAERGSGALGAHFTDLAFDFGHDLALALDEHPLQFLVPLANRRFGYCNCLLLGRHDFSRSFCLPHLYEEAMISPRYLRLW